MHRISATLAALALSLSACARAAPTAPQPVRPAEPVRAQMVETGSPLDQRIQQLDALLKGQMALDDYFTPSFLSAVPPEQFKAVLDGLIAQQGKPMFLVSDMPRGEHGATVQYAFERGIANIELDIASAAPNKVIGLMITGFTATGDSVDKVTDEIDALPGQTGYLVTQLDDAGNAKTLKSRYDDRQFAIGSTFKLYILAELAAQVKAGTRQWSDVAPLNHRSFSSASTGKWPKDSPMTLHTLASFMISVSDNSATDTLLFALGREAVERRLASIGHSAPDKTLPFLSTVEAFALKANPALRARFLKASEAQQRDLLDSEAAALTLDKIDNEALSKGPAAIDSIEWFASPNDLLWLMSHIRAQKNDRMLEILGINPGISPTAAKKWRYVGYKGGSEPGVISMTLLLQSQAGKWYVVTGSWNNSEAEVDNGKFAGLMERLVGTLAE
jgi:beta-lactamase class A